MNIYSSQYALSQVNGIFLGLSVKKFIVTLFTHQNYFK